MSTTTTSMMKNAMSTPIRYNALMHVVTAALALATGLAHAQLIPGIGGPPVCDPNGQHSCAPGTVPPTPTVPPTGPGTCGPGHGGATCAVPGPAATGIGPGINVGAGNPINVITGNKYQREVDMAALPGVLGLEIVRHYNSVFSSPSHSNGITGRGWKLSYETDLYAIGSTLQIVQADGTRVIFNRDARSPSLCASANPADGTVRVTKTRRGEEYVWTWVDGRELSFDHQGKLVQILAPSGQFVSMQHDSRGMLLSVTDPQGRSLRLHYLDKAQATSADAFRGVQNIDSPVGRFSYAYGSTAPRGATLAKSLLLANLVKVGMPAGAGANAVSRIYHYENPQFPTLLTGISVQGSDPAGKVLAQRIATYGYDVNGKGNLTVKGEPARLKTGPDGQPVLPAVLVAGTGLEQVTLDSSGAGVTVISNSLGQKTTYRHAIVGGEFRLLEVRGAGCAGCGETNVRYGYDSKGRLTDTTRLSIAGAPVSTVTTALDGIGRVIKVSKLVYQNGKPGASEWQTSYAYVGASAQPAQIARPSVVPGHDYLTTIEYGASGAAKGLPVSITESGFIPTVDGAGAALAISRRIAYRYDGYGQRIEIDGPLANASVHPGPDNSDITRTEYDPKTKLVTRTIAPGNIVTEVLERDAALRPSVVRTSDGAGVHTATIRNNWRGQPEEIRIDASAAGAPGAGAAAAAAPSRTVRYQYDDNGRLSSVTQPGKLTTRYRYDSAGRLSERILPDGSRLVMQHDSEGRQLRAAMVDAFGADAAGRVLTSTAFGYDAANRVSEVGDAAGSMGTLQYTEAGQVAQMSNALGTSTRFEYDANGVLASRTVAADTPDAATVKLGYDSHGQATLITDANGVRTERRFDDFGRKVIETNPDRGISVYRYDEAGRLIARIDETHSTTRYRYDVAGHLVAVGADAAPNLLQYRYLGQRLVEVFSSPDGKPEHASERTAYLRDGFGQVLEETRTLARVDQPVARGAQAAALPGLTFVTRNEYDEAGRLLVQTLPDGHRVSYRYTPADDGAGAAQTGARSRPGQLNAILFDDSVLVSDIEQSVAEGLTGYTSSNGIRQSITFDARGRIAQLKAITQARRADASGWWNTVKGWFSARDDAASRIVYSQTNRYDAGGRVTGIERQQGGSATRVASATRSEQFGYDRLDRLNEMAQQGGVQLHLAYDNAGNRTEKRTTDGAASALRTVANNDAVAPPGAQRQRYRYAAGTNRLIGLTEDEQAGQTGSSTGRAEMRRLGSPAGADQAMALMDAAWIYHATGVPQLQMAAPRRTRAANAYANRRIVYNTALRPIAVYDATDTLLASYYYNSQGERVAKTVYPAPDDGVIRTAGGAAPQADTVYSLYSEQRLAAETDRDGRITAHYIYLNGKPVAKIVMAPGTGLAHGLWRAIRTVGGLWPGAAADPGERTATIYPIHTDHLGTPQALTDAQQQLVWQADTDAFGNAQVRYAQLAPAGQPGAGAPFVMNLRLPGQVYDAETGLNQNYYRDYDPRLGRYTTPDPLGLAGGMNPYVYASSNPLANIDPLGLYESDVHYYTTFFLAVTAGVDPADARMMALATQNIDEDEMTRPMIPGNMAGSIFVNQAALVRYHFTQDGYDPQRTAAETLFHLATGMDLQSYTDRRVNNPSNPQLSRLLAASNFAKTDPNANCRTSMQLFGEYLHSFEDTFAHRDKNSNPYSALDIGLGIGHGLGAHNPDYTFNHFSTDIIGFGSWSNNETRTTEMEKEVFAKFKQFAKPTNQQNSWASIAWTMGEFTKFNASEEVGNLDQKIAILNDALKYLGYTGIDLRRGGKDGFDAVQAGKNRFDNLHNLKPSDYTGAIVPQGMAPLPK